jgi:putative membrane protein insertion efficiency factor
MLRVSSVEPAVTDRVEGLAARLVLALLRGYKILLSPLFTGSCRFSPSCSDYMAEAIRSHGLWTGVWLGIRRLARCHPFGGHGFDPVPTRRV